MEISIHTFLTLPLNVWEIKILKWKSAIFTQPTPQDEVEVLAALEDWSRVCVAMEVLGVDRQEEEVFWLVIAAITDLGVMARYRYIYIIIYISIL